MYVYSLNTPINSHDIYGLFVGETIKHLSTAWGGIASGGPGALVGGIAGGVIGGALGGVPGAVIGGATGGILGSAFDSPSAGQLNYLEDLDLQQFKRMKEWEEIDKKVRDLEDKVNKLYERMGGSLDENPCK